MRPGQGPMVATKPPASRFRKRAAIPSSLVEQSVAKTTMRLAPMCAAPSGGPRRCISLRDRRFAPASSRGRATIPLDAPDHLVPLLRKLESTQPLAREERGAVLGLPLHIRELEAGQDLIREGDRPSHCCVLLDGFAQRYKMLRDGRRQILSFHIPGDLPDIFSLHLKVMGYGLATLSRSRVGFVPRHSLRRLMQEHSR